MAKQSLCQEQKHPKKPIDNTPVPGEATTLLFLRIGLHNIMKKFILFAALALTAAGCGAGEGRDHSTGFKIAPGSVSEFNLQNTSFRIRGGTWNGISRGSFPPTNHQYAIIFLGTIGSTGKVGIAVDSDPSDADSFKLKIHFNENSIPSNVSYTAQDFAITVSNAGTVYSFNSSTDFQLSITEHVAGSVYRITSTGTAVLTPAATLSNLEIYALKVP
jgi:hypothetical protein